MSDTRATDVLVAFGIGLLSGAVAGLMLAPKSGEETRKQLGDMGQDALERGRQSLDSAKQAATDKARQIGQAVQEGVETTKQTASDHAKRIGQAVQEGREAYMREPSKS